MRTENYNLIEEDWIPVLMKDGTTRRISLGELFAKGDEIADLSLNPYERVAIMRLLICITMASLDENDLKDEAAWRTCLPKIKPAVAAYFAKWHDRFNFYGDHAFMQPDDISGSCIDVGKLFFKLSNGNNGTLFDHSALTEERDYSEAEIPLAMLSYLCYSSCGTHTKCKWGERDNPGAQDCPARHILHTYIQGSHVLGTVWLNLITKMMASTLPNDKIGRPLWELDGLCYQQLSNQCIWDTILGRLVPLTRLIKIDRYSRTMVLGVGKYYLNVSDNCVLGRELSGSVMIVKDKQKYLNLSADEYPWRNLSSVLSMPGAINKNSVCGAIALGHFYETTEDMSIWCGGLLTEHGKDVNIGCYEWRFDCPASLRCSQTLKAYESGVQIAKQVSDKTLYSAAKEFISFMKIDGVESVLTPTRRKFWDILEKQQKLLIRVAQGEAQMDEWKAQVLDAAKKAFEQSCPHQTGRQLEAYVKAMNKIYLPSDEVDKAKVRKVKKNVK